MDVNKKTVNGKTDILITIFIMVSTFIMVDSAILYLSACSITLLLLCIKDIRATLVGFCLTGMPFMYLLQRHTGISITTAILGVIVVQTLLLFFTNSGPGKWDIKKRNFAVYCFIAFSVYIVLLANYIISPKTQYNTYYIQFFTVYAIFYSLGGLIIIQRKLSLQSVLIPSMFFFVTIYPLLGFTILKMPAAVVNSTIGLRSAGVVDSISIGRISGCLLLLAFCLFWESRNELNKNIKIILNVGLAFVMAAPILWYSQTRQAILAVVLTIIIGSIFLLLKNVKINRFQKIVVFCLPILVTWASLYFLNWAEENLAQKRFTEINDRSRKMLWVNAWKGISDNPINGHGFAAYYSDYNMWPHNIFLEIWYDYGFIGFCLCIMICFFFIKRAFISKNANYMWTFIGMYWLIVAQASADLPRNTVLFLFVTYILLPSHNIVSKKFIIPILYRAKLKRL